MNLVLKMFKPWNVKNKDLTKGYDQGTHYSFEQGWIQGCSGCSVKQGPWKFMDPHSHSILHDTHNKSIVKQQKVKENRRAIRASAPHFCETGPHTCQPGAGFENSNEVDKQLLDTIRYDAGTIRWIGWTIFTCAQKLTNSQLLPHRTKQKWIMKKLKTN